jgi:hypothetical protein
LENLRNDSSPPPLAWREWRGSRFLAFHEAHNVCLKHYFLILLDNHQGRHAYFIVWHLTSSSFAFASDFFFFCSSLLTDSGSFSLSLQSDPPPASRSAPSLVGIIRSLCDHARTHARTILSFFLSFSLSLLFFFRRQF